MRRDAVACGALIALVGGWFSACSSSSSGGSSQTISNGGNTTGNGGNTSGNGSNTSSTVTPNGGTGLRTFGDSHAGEYELGPVEWTGSFNNSCSPYTSAIESQEGNYLTGLGLMWNGDGSLCDACVLVKTAMGKSLVMRVVTTGETTAPNNIDVSQEAYTLLNLNEYPRSMTWQVVECPATGNIQYQFQTEASEYWTSLWVRNISAPLAKVEVKSVNHADFTAMDRGMDGTFTDSKGFGKGSFTLRITSQDGRTLTDTYSSFNAGDVLASPNQF
jgi:expansin (peptidoglycan-binding protein)